MVLLVIVTVEIELGKAVGHAENGTHTHKGTLHVKVECPTLFAVVDKREGACSSCVHGFIRL